MKIFIWFFITFLLICPAFAQQTSQPLPVQAVQQILPFQQAQQTQAQPIITPQPAQIQPPQPPQPVQITVFGEQLFLGKFASEQYTGFNPDYQVAIGDRITIRMWGAVQFESTLTVDPQGNIFIPQVGPVYMLGVRNAELNSVVESAVRKVFKNIVGVYASLETAVPVKVFVTGFVKNPGLYGGLSSNSVLYYLDRAGGVDSQRGSFIDITVLRAQQIRKKVNLYDFLLNGKLELIQMVDGDTIFVAPKKSTFTVTGEVFNPFQFEFEGEYISGKNAMALAKPKPGATHLTVTRKQGLEKYTEYYALTELEKVKIYNGDEVTVLSDRYPGTILVRVEGAHMGSHALVLPYGATMKDVLPKIVPNVRSNLEAIQLFRKSVAQRQKEMLLTSLQQLQNYALTGRSETQEEANLRAKEAELIMKFIDLAKNIEPKGQITLGSLEEAKVTLLEDGDVITIPEKTSVVMVHGEVRFPNAILYAPDKDIDYYIEQSGGFTQRANKNVIVVLHQNGKFEDGDKAKIQPGDEIFVLPKIEAKSIEIVRGITQILYQIAVTARVLLLAW
ncbi:SLBB domain-containing protein [Thermodesulfovibrio aggregans]|uniref:SLBB domain-containing protein n=1 Tax=Thermodesulfovibrio aggregans TaxID=86166 RepID=A0A0U9HYG5_9BACT|nr:polysaccharide biosynthesis/export family protein [Thermodesulfovibrio aggregans]GAQ95141.1 SLBB domain-containing protein [Thermodesulfovibrio aggregans]